MSSKLSETLDLQFTWDMCISDKSIDTLEHPLYGTAFSKQEFGKMFNSVVKMLDGTTASDYVSFFFVRDTVNINNLVFCDSDAREDFLEWAHEENCIPSRKEVAQGEDDSDKKLRDEAEKSK